MGGGGRRPNGSQGRVAGHRTWRAGDEPHDDDRARQPRVRETSNDARGRDVAFRQAQRKA